MPQEAKIACLTHLYHDFRTPIAGIAALAKKIQAESPESHQAIAQLISATDALLACYTAGLTHLQMMESNAITFNLMAVFQRIIALLQPVVTMKNIVLETKIAELPNSVMGNSLLLTHVILELLVNAIKFTAAGKVQLSADIMRFLEDH